MVRDAMKARPRRPLFLIDIAVPRDIEPEVGHLDGVYLFNIDQLREVLDRDAAARRLRADRAAEMIEQEAVAFATRMRVTQTAVPLVSSLRARNRAIVENELTRLRAELSHLSETDWNKVERSVQSLENKLAHQPTIKIKEYAAEADDALLSAKMETVRELFGLNGESEGTR